MHFHVGDIVRIKQRSVHHSDVAGKNAVITHILHGVIHLHIPQIGTAVINERMLELEYEPRRINSFSIYLQETGVAHVNRP